MEEFPYYQEWLAAYEELKNQCSVPAALRFVQAHPATANYRKGPGGSTMLHQLSFWGVDRGVIESFKMLGCDPNIRNPKGQTAIEAAEAEGNAATAEAYVAAFGSDDSEQRTALLEAAKRGDFVTAFAMLGERRHLCNTQSASGWGVAHHAAFFCVGLGVFRRLSDLGVLFELRTADGRTVHDVIQQYHPASSTATRLAAITTQLPDVQVGSRVSIVLHGALSVGSVTAIDGGDVRVMTRRARAARRTQCKRTACAPAHPARPRAMQCAQA